MVLHSLISARILLALVVLVAVGVFGLPSASAQTKKTPVKSKPKAPPAKAAPPGKTPASGKTASPSKTAPPSKAADDDVPGFTELAFHKLKFGNTLQTNVDWHFTLSCDGKWWALYRRQGAAEIHSLPDDQKLAEVKFEGFSANLCVSGDGQTLAISTLGKEGGKLGDGSQNSARTSFFSADGWKPAGVLQHDGVALITAGNTSLSPDGSLLAAASTPLAEKGRLRLWEVKSQKLVFDRENGSGLRSFARFSADGKRLLLVGNPPEVVDIATGKQRTFEPSKGNISCADFSPDGLTVALGLYNGEVQFGAVATGKLSPPVKLFEREIMAIRYAGNKRLLAASQFPGDKLRLYDDKGKVVAAQPLPEQTYVTQLEATADGSLVIAKIYGIQQAIIVWTTPLAKAGG
jgi:WD40 repeat protein